MTWHADLVLGIVLMVIIWFWPEDTCWLPWVDCSGLGYDYHVGLFCPETDENTEETRIATEETEPVDVDRDVEGGTGIWTYDCNVCGGQHRFLWGPPAPIHLEDEEGA